MAGLTTCRFSGSRGHHRSRVCLLSPSPSSTRCQSVRSTTFSLKSTVSDLKRWIPFWLLVIYIVKCFNVFFSITIASWPTADFFFLCLSFFPFLKTLKNFYFKIFWHQKAKKFKLNLPVNRFGCFSNLIRWRCQWFKWCDQKIWERISHSSRSNWSSLLKFKFNHGLAIEYSKQTK
jgi:hypothetical protein